MAPLHRRLAALRRRLRVVTLTRGVSAALCVVLAVAILAGLLDWHFQLPALVRAMLLVGMLIGAGTIAFRYLITPLAVRADNLSLALRVEECYPELNDALASTVQFLEQSSQERTATGSPTLRREAAKQAMKQAEKCDFNKAVNSRGIGWVLLGFATLAIAGVWFVYSAPGLASTALARLFEPFGGHSWTVLALEDCPHRVAVDQPYPIRGKLSGIVPESAQLEVQSIVDSDRIVPIKTDKTKETGSLETALDMTQHKGKFRFRIRAGDAVFPLHGWHEVEVVPPPEWVALNGLPSPQIELDPPRYTDLPTPIKLSPGTRTLDVIEGTRVRLQAAIDRPIVKAWVEYEPAKPVLIGAILSPLAASTNLAAAATANMGHMVWGRFPAVLSKDGKRMNLEFHPRVSATYHVYLQDRENLIKKNPADLRVDFDPIPVVQLERPASSQEVLADAKIAIKARVNDEQFAVRNVFLEYRRRRADKEWIDAEPHRVPLYTADGRKLKQVEVETTWSLVGLVENGQTVVIAACADDFNDVVTNPPGRSGEVELRVVSPKQLARIHDEKLSEIQQELLRLQRMQEEALNTVEQVQNNPGKEDYKKVVEAEQQQKQIRERVGMTKDEGLRGAVTRMQQALRDNEMPPSNLRDQLRTLNTELERIANEDLQQIEPNLAEARKEMDGGKNEKSAALDRAHELQEDAKESIDELLKFLDPWASVNVVKGQARELLREQRELKQKTEKLLPLQKEDPAKLAAEAAKAANAQNDLKQRMENLIKTMQEAGESRDQKGEKHTGKLLKEAAELAKNADLPEMMREAEENLENKNLGKSEPLINDAIKNQQESIDQLEKVIAALEERREDEVARLMKKQAEAHKKLEELIERLQKKAPKTEEEKTKTKAELEKLQEDVKQTARELAQMQADKASKTVNRAAEKLERALRQLEKQEDPEENRKEALQELENAVEELAEAEQELAREQLAQIGDQLKALKERQDAAIKESKDLHERSIGAAKKWSNSQLTSLRNLGQTQRDLQHEAEGLKKKLEGAKVFEHILERAGVAMEQAADLMEERKENALLRGVADLEEEELAFENRTQVRTVDLQQQAAKRLQNLLEALKDAEPMVAKKEKDEGKEPPKNNEPQGGGGGSRPPGDNIPDAAQLKALREEQRTLNERTAEMSVVIANSGPIGAAALAREQLRFLHDEQAELERLLIEMAAAVQ